MDPLTVSLELGLMIWAALVLRKEGWRTENERLVWIMTGGALITNLLLYLEILPILRTQTAAQNIAPGVLYGLLAFRVVEWTVMVHLMARLALVVVHRHGLPGGFAHLHPNWSPRRTVLRGIAIGGAAAGILVLLVWLWQILGILERPIWIDLVEAGATWQAGIVGGVRNLFCEESVTRLGVQTLILYHLRRYRRASVVAIVLSSLFFEVWHSGGTDFYFINFTASLLFAWIYTRDGYESAAIGHCVTDWLGLALPIYLLS